MITTTRECSICLEDIHPKNKYTTDCKHSFHLICIVNVKISNETILTCPLCRRELEPENEKVPVFTKPTFFPKTRQYKYVTKCIHESDQNGTPLAHPPCAREATHVQGQKYKVETKCIKVKLSRDQVGDIYETHTHEATTLRKIRW